MKIHNEKLLENFYKHDKKNIAIFTDIFFPSLGGASIVIHNLAKTLFERNNYNIVVVTGDVKGYEDNVPYPVIRCKSIKIPKAFGDSLPIPKFDNKFKKLLKNLNIDLIHVHTVFGICTFALRFAKKNNISIVFHGHSKFNEEYNAIVKSKFVAKMLAKRAFNIVNKMDCVITVSENTKSTYIAQGIKKEIKVVSNATEMKPCENEKEAFEYINKKHKIDEKQENVLLFVSRMEIKTKNIDMLLQSLKIIKEKNIDFKLLMVGNGKDFTKIQELSKQLGLSNNVVMVGEVRDRQILGYYYKRADLFVFPSVVDTCAIVKFEAAVQNTPTLAVKNTGTSEEIVDDYNGFLTDNNAKAYAEKMLSILRDRKKMKIVSENAHKTLSRSWTDIAIMLEKLYYEKTSKSNI